MRQVTLYGTQPSQPRRVVGSLDLLNSEIVHCIAANFKLATLVDCLCIIGHIRQPLVY
jgi:hypothetical protein